MILFTLSLWAHAADFVPVVVPDDALRPPPYAGVSAGSTYESTEESPAITISRAALKLSDAQRAEQGSRTASAMATWKASVREHGAHDMGTLRAHTEYLRLYGADLDESIAAYREVEDSLAGLVGRADDGGPASEMRVLVERAQTLQAETDRKLAMNDQACWIDRTTCVPPDAETQELLHQIQVLMAMTDGAAPNGGLSADAVRERASLLRTRAELLRMGVRIAAAQVAAAIATPRDGSGRLPPIPDLGLPAPADAVTQRYTPGSPYR